MAFADVWNLAYEGLPADNENISLGASRIRDFKENVRERANIDHSWGDTNDSGKHLQLTLALATGTPGTPTGTDGCVWSQQVSGNTELFWRDQLGNVLQLTNVGKLNITTFASGTLIPFMQASAPAGWTQYTGFNDQMIRLVNGGGGGSGGGSWSISGTSVSTSVSSSASTSVTTTTGDAGSSVSGTVAGHTLTIGEIPGHSHNITGVSGQGAGNGGPQSGSTNATVSSSNFTTDNGNGLGGGAHVHGWSGSLSLVLSSSSSASTSVSSPASSSFSNDATWRPAYVNAIVGQKT